MPYEATLKEMQFVLNEGSQAYATTAQAGASTIMDLFIENF